MQKCWGLFSCVGLFAPVGFHDYMSPKIKGEQHV